MSSEAIRVGVVGLGKIAQLHHLPILLDDEKFEIAAVCDRSQRLGEHLVGQYGLKARVSVDYRELLGGEVDALVVTNRHHGPILLAALEAQVPIFVEKPMCWGLEEALEIENAVTRTGTPLLVGYMKRFDPAIERVMQHKLLGDSDYIRVHTFAGGRHRFEKLRRVTKPMGSLEGPDESATIDSVIRGDLDHPDEEAVALVRSLAELGVHNLNLLRAVAGPPTVIDVRHNKTQLGRLSIIQLMSGQIPTVIEILPDFSTSREWDDHLTAYSGSGWIDIEFPSPFLHNVPTLLRQRNTEGLVSTTSESFGDRESAFRRELTHFYDIVVGGTSPRIGASEGRSDLELVYRIAQAASV